MGKGKKKVGKGGVKEMEELESSQISEDPSTSATQPAEEEDEEGGLTGAARRKKKKETKKAERDSKKVEKSIKDVSEAPGISVSAIESALPSLTLAEEAPKPKEEVPKPKEEVPKPAEEEDGGLGLGGPRKRQPRKKKPADAAKAAVGAATPVQGLATGPAPQSSAPAMQPATPGAPPQAAPSPWARPTPTPAVVSAGPQQGAPRPPPQTALPRQPPTSGPPTPAGDYGRSGPSQALPASASLQAISGPDSSQQTRATRSEVACRFKIPKKILGNQVPARQISVLTNYLPMTIKPLKIYRYDVSFKPDRPKKFFGKAFTLSKEKHFKQNLIAFDQMKNCYALTPLKDVTQNDRYLTNVELKDPNGRVMAFEVSYKYTGMVDLGTIMAYVKSGATSLSPPTEAIQCIDVILRQGTLEDYVKAGRQFFKRPTRPIDLGDGLEMWTGLFQSGIFTSRAFINIDVAHKGFPKQQPLVQALNDFRLDPRRSLEMQRGRGYENFQIFLKGLRVLATIGGDSSGKGVKREFICNGIVGSCKTETFCFEEPNGKKTMMTVQEYFERVKKVRIKYPDLNCVWVGSRDKTIFYPMELLEVSYGQAQNKQLNENQLATMVRQAATPPDERKKKIEEVIQNMNYSKNDYFKKFGLDISDQFHPVKARVLQPPQLQVGDGQIVMPKRGQWIANKVFKAEPLLAWGVIAVEVDPTRCQPEILIDLMMKQGAMMGMTVSQPILKRFNVRIQELQSVLFNAVEKGVKFLFVIVSTRGRDYYHKVKQLAEREVGILTQCIKEFTATTRMNQATARNILLKVNSKLMGVNQTLSQRSLPRCMQAGDVMVVGADVTHPSPDQSNIPSIAAVTASIDSKCFVYNIQLSIQTPKKEMIVEFEDMMLEHLQIYRKNQGGKLPRKIYVFRDGVSEGQFAQVMNSELQAVLNAYKTVAGPSAKPEVLFLLVQKRHHTRLFVPNSTYNVEPGTVVDEDIVHASELDFYMVSHQAIKGTARPTRYHAVCNDGGLPHDEVEQLTYYLCHLYSRCTRAVSYPAPTYYAHLACLRARSLTFGERFDNRELELRPKRLRVMDKILQCSSMFFV